MLRNNTLHQTSIKFIFLYYLIMCFYEEMCYNICCIFSDYYPLLGRLTPSTLSGRMYLTTMLRSVAIVQVDTHARTHARTHAHTHTHTRTFNGPFSGTTQVSRYQKGKTNLDFTVARDSEWQWHQLGHMQVCTSRCPSCRPTNSVKALKACK